MKVLNVRNVHTALPHALQFLERNGIKRDSRNGPVLVAPWPVTTVYEKPLENVIFWPQRDANPFFHLYEALWMLAGRNDVAPLCRYVAKSTDYSDDGKTLHGAYGHRWRKHFGEEIDVETGIGGYKSWEPLDQLRIIVEDLKKNPESRRNILQMWDCTEDLGRQGKDLPCNTIATFQRGLEGELNLVVFCRSNDIIWGCYGANAVQFSFLLEYMATWIGCPVGTYTQVSVNWHAYDNEVWKQVETIRPDKANFVADPYQNTFPFIRHIPMISEHKTSSLTEIEDVNHRIKTLLAIADCEDPIIESNLGYGLIGQGPWADMVYRVLMAHKFYKKLPAPNKYTESLELLNKGDQKADWIVAAKEWIQRRYETWIAKQILLEGGLTHP